MDLYADAAKLPRKIPNHLARVRGVSIDIDGQYRSASRIDADCGSQNLRLPHQVGCDLSLWTAHNGLDSGMSFVQNARWRPADAPRETKTKAIAARNIKTTRKNRLVENINGIVRLRV